MVENNKEINLYGGSATFKLHLKDANKDYYILANNLIHYIRDEKFSTIGKPSLGLYVPNAELKCLLADTKALLELLKDSKVEIEVCLFKDSGDTTKTTYNYKATNFDYDLRGKDIELTIYMIADLGDFMSKSAMVAYRESTSIQAIYECAKKGNLEITQDSISADFSTNDSMTWIQANVSYLQMVSNILKHINLQFDDEVKDTTQDNQSSISGNIILSAFNNDKLRLQSYKSAMENNAKIGFYLANAQNVANASIKYPAKNIRIESSLGLYEFLSDIKGIPIINIVGENRNNSIISSIFNIFSSASKTPKKEISNRVLPPKIDCGNTHKSYWQSAFNNEKMLAQIYRNIVYLQVDNVFIDDSVNLLDTAMLDLSAPDESDSDIQLKGNFLVLGISKYMDKQQISNQIVLAKADYSS